MIRWEALNLRLMQLSLMHLVAVLLARLFCINRATALQPEVMRIHSIDV